MANIYLADDEKNIRLLTSMGLEDEGHTVTTFADGQSLILAIKKKKPDLILLDIMMPEKDGIEVCKELRNDKICKKIPIIMLTAKDSEIDKIIGLEMGADDYVTKPFSIKELAARIKALLRRVDLSSNQEGDDVLEVAGVKVDISAHKVMIEARSVELTAKEFDLLILLMQNVGKVLSREVLLDKIWGVDYFGDTRTVDVHVRYLRQKVEDLPEEPTRILTVRGYGYKFNEEG